MDRRGPAAARPLRRLLEPEQGDGRPAAPGGAPRTPRGPPGAGAGRPHGGRPRDRCRPRRRARRRSPGSRRGRRALRTAVSRARTFTASVMFLLSGAAGLVFQVSWQRLLALQSGVGIHSVALITATFMAGLGIGSHLGGVLSARLSARQALGGYAALEAAVALFAHASVPLYYAWL